MLTECVKLLFEGVFFPGFIVDPFDGVCRTLFTTNGLLGGAIDPLLGDLLGGAKLGLSFLGLVVFKSKAVDCLRGVGLADLLLCLSNKPIPALIGECGDESELIGFCLCGWIIEASNPAIRFVELVAESHS